jgi:hypothetical protein
VKPLSRTENRRKKETRTREEKRSCSITPCVMVAGLGLKDEWKNGENAKK